MEVRYSGPERYFPLINAHSNIIVDGLSSLGIKVEEVEVGARELAIGGRLILHVVMEIKVNVEESGLMRSQLEKIVYPLVDRFREALKRELYPIGVVPYIRTEDIRIVPLKKEVDKLGNVVVDAPPEFESAFRRYAQGIAIGLRERGIKFETLVVSVYEDGKRLGLRVVLVPLKEFEGIEKTLRGLAEKYMGFLRYTLKNIKVSLDGVEVITSKIKPWPARILAQKERIIAQVDEIIEDEDVKSLMVKLR
ncbi:hypothetical protein PYCH_07420 [Pyrococcus yayanosii CH1]|uniref:Uncharacterized protein n=2 Tax=Pyrococcus TaxID=2260 RepID=F8AIV4_PYRYC|nr:hypothetical protein PYCH_07420 [Pyrococcus yayanosii CH1]